MENKDALKSAKLGNLISYTCDKDIYYIDGADKNRDLTTVQKYKTISDNGTYVMVIVEVEWVCAEHTDADNDYVCDDCREYTLDAYTIVDYDAQAGVATVYANKPGKYMLIFADYEEGVLKNANIVNYDFVEGMNTVSQTKDDFVLESGDKVMLWRDMLSLFQICNPLTLE